MWENPNLVKIRQKCWAVYVKTSLHFIVVQHSVFLSFDSDMQLKNTERTYCYIASFVFIQIVISKLVNITVCIIFQWHLHYKMFKCPSISKKGNGNYLLWKLKEGTVCCWNKCQNDVHTILRVNRGPHIIYVYNVMLLVLNYLQLLYLRVKLYSNE